MSRRRYGQLFRYTPSILASAIILVIFYLVFLIFEPFIGALVLSAVIVLLFYPIHARLAHKISNTWASLVSTFAVFIIIIVPGVLITLGIVNETITLSQTIGSVSLKKIMMNAYSITEKIGFDLDVISKDAVRKLASHTGQIASQMWNILLSILVTLFATFFFFRDAEKIVAVAKSVPLKSATWREHLINEITTTIKSNMVASFASASLQGLVGGLAFAWLGLPAPVLWGTVMAFFSLFPFIGSWLVWLPVSIVLILSGQTWNGIFLIIIGIAVVNPIDNILRPAIVASTGNLNGLLVLLGLLGGLQAFGLSGLLIGPVLLILVVAIMKSSRKYLKDHNS